MEFPMKLLIGFLFLKVAYCIVKRPQIKLNNQIIDVDSSIQKIENDTLQLLCFADYPIKWVLPDNELYANYSNPDNDGRLKTVSSESSSKNVTILITDLKWTDTGFYRCVAADSKETDLNPTIAQNENRFYLYVKDFNPIHLFLHLKGEIISFKRHEISYINCLVTDMSATVEISFETKVEQNLQYVKRFGFKIPPDSLQKVSWENAQCKATVSDAILPVEDFLSFIIVAHDKPVENFAASISPEKVEYLFYLKNNVTMTCTANSQYKTCQWETPKGLKISKHSSIDLTINDIDFTDSGTYKCSCNDTMYKSADFMEKNITVRKKIGQITLVETSERGLESVVNETNSKKIYVYVKILLPPGYNSSSHLEVKWYHQYSIIMNPSENITKEIQKSSIFTKIIPRLWRLPFSENPEVRMGLNIKNTTANLSGDYILSIRAVDEVVNYTFNLKVISKVNLNLLVTEEKSTEELNSNYLEKEKIYDVWCIAEGETKQKPTLWYRPCIADESGCDKNEWKQVTDNTFYKAATFQNALVARVFAPKTGTYSCKLGSINNVENSVTKPFIVTDILHVQENQGFSIERKVLPNLTKIYQYSKVILTCKMQKYDKYKEPEWFYQSLNDDAESALKPMNSDYNTIETVTDEYSSKSILSLNNIQLGHTGIYICQSSKANSNLVRKSNMTISVTETVSPWIGFNSSQMDDVFTYTEPGVIYCDAHGEPFPNIQWSKDGQKFVNLSRQGITLEKNNTILKINTVVVEDAGSYTCTVSNFAGQKESMTFIRTVVGTIPDSLVAILASASGVLVLFVLALVVAVVVQRLKLKKKLKRLREIHQKLLEPSDKEVLIDVTIPLNEQTDNLKYSQDFEIPVHFVLPLQPPKSVLGKGEFGEVVKSVLHIPASERPAVAIKIIRSTLPVDQINELLSEVKIMIHVGEHVNVLPLIGAVTSCLGMNKLYVITEYCAFGSLLKFLQGRRNSFTNELLTLNNPTLNHKKLFPVPVGYLMPLLPKPTQVHHRSHSLETSNHHMNDLSTSDLLYFSYQIANGMEFLSSKNVIHRDLATRNILITENNLIRISDFGLSRHGNVYQIKKNKFKLPYPWLAYESLVDYSFSVQSDIWSFGIVLWEIFTLGEQPFNEYRGFNELTNALKNNVRLPKPNYASDKIYDLMKRCWLLKPELRPSFTECKKILADELKLFCKLCHEKLETINNPENQPDYSPLRSQFVLEPEPPRYETPNSQKFNEMAKNHYYPFPTPQS